MEIQGVLIEKIDEVVTVCQKASVGDLVKVNVDQTIEYIKVREEIPQFHKIARASVRKGEVVHKYGQKIGIAVSDIEEGTWVHTHNLKSESML